MAPALAFRNRLAALTPGLRYLVKNSPLGPLGDNDLVDPEGIDRIWAYDELPLWGAGETYTLHRHVRQLLPKIRQPVLIFQGRRDAQLTSRAAQILYDEVSSRDKKLVWLENSGHNLLADGERQSVWTQTYDWMMKRVKHA
jgi:esterase/lipase